jgi:hypothetical protein
MASKDDHQHASPAVHSQAVDEHERGSSWLSSRMPSALKSIWPQQREGTALQPYDKNQDYLVGVRGILVPMAFLWTFLHVFAPAAVKGSANDEGPGYQLALRKSLSVLFWNDTLIYGSIMFLSARTICLPFLLESSKSVLASTVFRRGIRLWFPVALTLIVVRFTFSQEMVSRVTEFAALTGNEAPDFNLYVLPTSLSNFNAIYMTFWITHNFQAQAANWAFPTQMLWVITAVFQQSYTVYMTMIIIPYTRARWRVMGAFAFILTAWWVYSWAWFSISGLLIADAVMNMGLGPNGSGSSFTIRKIRIPFWSLGALFMAAGFIMQFVWTAARPDLQNTELYYHTGIYSTGGLMSWVDPAAPQLRADCYLIILGFSLMLETSSLLQSIFRSKLLVLLGKRSLSMRFVRSEICLNSMLTASQVTSSSSPSSFTLSASGLSPTWPARTCLATREQPGWLS